MRVVFIILFILKCWQLSAQCPNSLVINDLEDVEKFVQEYPDCTELNSLSLQGVNATIQGLEQLKSVRLITLKSTNIDTLDLTEAFSVLSADFVENLVLKRVNLVFRDSLNKLSIVDSPLLSNLKIIGDNFDTFILNSTNTNPVSLIFDNEMSKQPCIKNLLLDGKWQLSGLRPRVLNHLQILNHIQGFTSFDSINLFLDLKEISHIDIYRMDFFSCLGITQLKELSILSFIGIPDLDFETVDQYHQEMERITLIGCENLSDLTPWPNCSLKSLEISNCPKIQSLKGIHFDSTVRYITMQENESLRDLGSINDIIGFDSLVVTGNIYIESNPELSWCSYDVICNHIAQYPDRVVIENNKDHCETKEDVAEACLSNTEEEPEQPIFIYPNPNNGTYRVLGLNGQAEISIFNMNGAHIRKEIVEEGKVIDMQNLIKGTYLYKVTNGQITKKGKLVVM